jgi:hypothetical protein
MGWQTITPANPPRRPDLMDDAGWEPSEQFWRRLFGR